MPYQQLRTNVCQRDVVCTNHWGWVFHNAHLVCESMHVRGPKNLIAFCSSFSYIIIFLLREGLRFTWSYHITHRHPPLKSTDILYFSPACQSLITTTSLALIHVQLIELSEWVRWVYTVYIPAALGSVEVIGISSTYSFMSQHLLLLNSTPLSKS